MTDLRLTDLILILIGITNVIGQWYFRSRPAGLYVNEQPTIKPSVTRTAPGFVNENHALQEESAIVEPKTPQRIAWEEQEELRKMSLRPR